MKTTDGSVHDLINCHTRSDVDLNDTLPAGTAFTGFPHALNKDAL